MVDIDENLPPLDNIRTLLYYLGLAIDERLLEFRKNSPYEHARPSDARVFVTAAHQPRTISDIARELKITRQAAQRSVQRLVQLQVAELQAVPGNHRDKLVIITPRGIMARNIAVKQIRHIEDEFVATIGEQGLADLRQTLGLLLAKLQDYSVFEDPLFNPPRF